MQILKRTSVAAAVLALAVIPLMGAKGCTAGKSSGSSPGSTQSTPFQEYGSPGGRWWFGHNPPTKPGGRWVRRGNVRFGPAKGQPIWIFMPS